MYWKLFGNLKNNEFQICVSKGVDYFRSIKTEYPSTSIIIDLSGFHPQEELNLKWVNNEIITLLYMENGIKIIALIGSPTEEGKRLTDEFYEKTEQLHEIKIVNSVEEAKNWISDENQRSKSVGDFTMYD